MASKDYLPALDGVRAVAIAAVVAYHLGYLGGGWIGVDVFFVLSGYLITSILLRGREGRGRIWGFWGRRARRLLPAVLLVLLALSVYAWVAGPGLVPAQLRSPALTTLFYVANWGQIASSHSYFAQFAAPSPLQHTWSLAVEEQYYLAWPLLLGTLLVGTRRLGERQRRRVLIGATLGLAVASAVWMGFAAHLFGPTRA
jgi:peptidoglycan/LPS O-acetylase OafA/YrhL